MALQLELIGCPSPSSPIYNDRPDNMADMMVGINMLGKTSTPGGQSPCAYVYVPLDVNVPKAAGTYDVNATVRSKQCDTIEWYHDWVGYLNSTNGDHHHPNPCSHSWIGGQLTRKTYCNSSTFPYRYTGKSTASARWYPGWDGTGAVPGDAQLPSYVSAGDNYYGYSIFAGGGKVTATGQKPQGQAWDQSKQSGCWAWMNAGAMRPISNPNSYGPNFASLSVGQGVVTVRLWGYMSWANSWYHPDKFAYELTRTATVTVKSVTVKNNFAGTAALSVAYTETGWIAQSGLGPGYPDTIISKSWTDEYSSWIASNGQTRSYPPTKTAANQWIADATAWAGVQFSRLNQESFALQNGSESEALESLSAALRNQDALESNWIENATGFGNPIELLMPLAELAGSIRSKDWAGVAKALAGAYLEWKYVIAPDISDYQDVKANAGRLYKDHVRSVGEGITRQKGSQALKLDDSYGSDRKAGWTTSLSMKINNEPWAKTWNALCAFGIDPSLTNLWDLVPYSFVVDWFVPVGKYLDEMYAQVNLQFAYHDISQCQSFLDETSVICDLANWEGTLSYRYYVRKVRRGFSEINRFEAGVSLNPHLSASQLMQGASLVVQRLL